MAIDFKLGIFLFFLFSSSSYVEGQAIDISFHHLNQEHGLSQGLVAFVSRDSRGFVWLSTVDGLNRFDGQSVRVYRPSANDPNALLGNILTSKCYESKNGDLWFTTYNAVHRYVRQYDHFEIFQLKNYKNETATEDYYAFHFDQEEKLWLRTGVRADGRLHVFDTQNKKDSILCSLGGFRSVAIEDDSGEVAQILSTEFARGVNGAELIELKNNFEKKTWFRDEKQALPQRRTHEAFVEKENLVWLGLSNGMASLDPQSGLAEVFDIFAGEQIGQVWSVQPFKEDLLFAATFTKGLLVFDKNKKRFVRQFRHQLDDKHSLQSNEIHNLYLDKQDNLWACQWSHGMSYVNLNKNKFQRLTETDGANVFSVLPVSDGKIWVQTRQEILIYSPQKKLLERRPHFDKRNTISEIINFENGETGYSTPRFLLAWGEDEKRFKIRQHFREKFNGLAFLPDGRRLASFGNRLVWVKEKKDTLEWEPCLIENNFKFKYIESLYVDKQGRIYICENSETLLVFKMANDSLSLWKEVQATGQLKSFYEEPEGGGVLVGTTTGLLKMDANGNAKMLNEEDGLTNETFYTVMPDAKGRFWLASNRGMLRYDPINKTTRRYNEMDGLFGKEFNTNAAYQSPDGEIWAGGIGGLIVFHPDSVKDVSFEPKVQFTNILINDEPLESDVQVSELESLQLAYEHNTISFEFVAIEFSDPTANQFRYRMRGYDRDWVSSGTRGFARYSNLPPGEHIFEVLAANGDGIWTKAPKVFEVLIKTPFWQTWWFYLLCLILVSGIIYGWFRYRLEQALKLERMRVKISSDLHDDVGGLLSGLAMQTEILELTAKEADKPRLKRIAEMSRHAMARMRDTVWAIDARKDKFENLLDRMREHAAETLTPSDILFELKTEKLDLKKNLPTDVRQNVYLIFKEALTNIAKHSNADRVKALLKNTPTHFEMRIKDNGQSVQKDYKTTGQGLANMKMRAERIGGSLEMKRKDGFEVVLKVKK